MPLYFQIDNDLLPLKTVKWYKNNQQLGLTEAHIPFYSDNIIRYKNDSITIHSVTESDMGEYMCLLTVDLMEPEVIRHTFYPESYIISNSSSVSLLDGANVTFDCSAWVNVFNILSRIPHIFL